MADKKISACTSLTTPSGADVLPILDSSESADANKNKKITLTTLFNKAEDGSVGSPTFAWGSDGGNTGIYRSAANEIGFSVSSTFQGAFSSTGFKLGSGTAAAPLHIFSGSDTTDNFILQNDSASADTAPDLVLYRNSPSPAADDNLGAIFFRGEDSADNTHEYAQITAGINDPTNGSEDGILDLMTSADGTVASRIRLYNKYVGIGEVTPAYPLHVTTSVTGTALRLECSADDAASGGDLTLFRRRGASAVGQNNDLLGTIYYRGKNNDSSSAEEIDYGAIEGSITDVTDEAEDGRLRFKVQKAGTLTTQITVESTGVTFAENVTFSEGITFADAKNIVLNTTTGTKIGTATGQKLGFYNATPVDQPAAVADLAHSTTSGSLPTPDGTVNISNAASPTNAELLAYCVELETKLEAALARLRELGLIAT